MTPTGTARKRRTYLGIMLGALAGAWVPGCAREAECGEACGTAIILTTADADGLVPLFATTANGVAIGDQLFLKLAELGPGLNTQGDAGFEPRLAKAWEFEDSLTIVFRLDGRARWHDGEAVTTRDVAFTFDLYRDTLVNSPSGSDLDRIASVVARDDSTVAFTFTRDYAEQFYDATYHMRILPAHLLDTVPRGALRSHAFNQQPVGSGPYRLRRWESGVSIELEATDDFFLGRPGLGRLVWQIVPDLNVAVGQMVTGEADVLEVVGGPDNLERLREDDDVTIVTYPAGFYAYVAFNFRSPTGDGRPHELFTERDLRRAVSMAVDREAIARALFGEFGSTPRGPTSRMLSIWKDEEPALPYDPDAARDLLAAAGWADTDGDGVLDRNGKALEFDLILPSSSSLRQRAAVILQEQLRQVGVRVRLSELEFLTWSSRSSEGRFDATFGIWGQSPTPRSIDGTWTSAEPLNHGHYSNQEFDRLVARALDIADPTIAGAVWDSALATIQEDAPAIWIASPLQTAAVNQRFENVSFRPDQWAANLWQWRVPPGRDIARDRTATR